MSLGSVALSSIKKPRVKDAVREHGFGPGDFARWIHDRKIEPLNTVRQLPAVLANARARNLFITQGMKSAIAALDRPEPDTVLKEASIGSLARALATAIGQLPYNEVKRLRDNPDDEVARALFDTHELLQGLISELRDTP